MAGRNALAPDVARARHGVELATATTRASSTLDGGERLRVVDALSSVLGGAYCHLPQKRAGYAFDPVQALQLLRRRCVELTDGEFHLAITSLVTGLRDAHTRYRGPASLRGRVAALPFLIEQYGPADAPTFVVSKVADDARIGRRSFVAGVKLEYWNGIPFSRAVDLYAERETGGRPDSRRSRALESFTFRALDYGPPPDEHWVIIGYRTLDGKSDEIRMPWRLVEPGRAATAVRGGSRGQLKVGADPAAEAVRRTKKLMFAPASWAADQGHTTRAGNGGRGRGASGAGPVGSRAAAASHDAVAEGEWLPTEFEDTLAARVVTARRRKLGYLRIWSFDVSDHEAFVAETVRLVEQLPTEGLIIDVRGNPGGLIWAAERLLQLFTPNPITPTRFALVASPITRAMAASPFNRLELEAWAPSLEEAIATGELYSQPLPLTDPQWCNDVGQRYAGPVVAVADPNTYSSGDLFCAGFVDNHVGPLITVGQATGAGGANVWTDAFVRDALTGTPYAFPPLPADVGFTLAIRRAVRGGPADGMAIEDTGVVGIPYAMTRRDLLEDNVDLRNFCADVLAQQPVPA